MVAAESLTPFSHLKPFSHLQQQGLGYAKAAFDENKKTFIDEHTIYVLAMNGASIRLIYYNLPSFQLVKKSEIVIFRLKSETALTVARSTI